MKKLLLTITASLLLASQAFAAIEFNTQEVKIDLSMIRQIYTGRTFFSGNYVNLSLYEAGTFNVIWPAMQSWRNTKSNTKAAPVLNFSDRLILKSGNVSGWSSWSTGQTDVGMMQLTEADWLAARAAVENYALTSGKCSVSYQKNNEKYWTCTK